MSLYSALRSGVSGLFAQTQAMSMISDNITNTNTTGYKSVRARFSSLVGSSGQGTFSAGVVNAVSDRSVAEAGQVTSSKTNTHVAVNGKGFFAVTKADSVFLDEDTGAWRVRGEVLYTRAGDFTPDSNGNLRNSAGYVLLGWQRNSGNNGYEVSNLVSEFTAVNVAGTVGKPLPTQHIIMNANLNASAKDGETFTMTAPMYSRQGGISNIEMVYTKIGDGISSRRFRVEARVTSGSAQLINPQAIDAGPTGAVASVKLNGIQDGTSPRTSIMNFDSPVTVVDANIGNLKVAFTSNGIAQEATAVAITARGGKVEVTWDTDVPADATDKRVYTSGGITPLHDDATPAAPLTVPPASTLAGTAGTKFSGLYDLGIISFDASGQSPTLAPPENTRNEAAGFFGAGSIVNGRLTLDVDHSSDGAQGVSNDSDDASILFNFSNTGASAGMTSYESASTIYSIDQDGNGSGELQSVNFNARGELQAVFSRGSPQFLAQVPLMAFNNPNALFVADGNAYRASDDAGVGVSRVPGTGDSGTVSGSSLEASNADIATEFTEMIIVQRAYSAATKIITTADEMLDEVIRAKR